MDPELEQSDYGFQVAVVLMAAGFVQGPNTDNLAAFTGYPATLQGIRTGAA